MKNITLIGLVAMFLLLGQAVFSQDSNDNFEDFNDSEAIEVEGIANGGSVKCICKGKVPWKRLSSKATNSNCVVDPETGEEIIFISAEGETDKVIIGIDLTTTAPINDLNVLKAFLMGRPLEIAPEKTMLSLTSTNKTTGETIEVTNEVRKLIEAEGTQIDLDRTSPVRGTFKVSRVKNNLASGIVKLVFKNTERIVERASEIIGEDIQLDENGKASAICKFSNIPVNGDLGAIPDFDLSQLPEKLVNKIPEGIDINDLPEGLDLATLPEGVDISDLSNIPPGFELGDILQLPSGFSIEDIANVPPGFNVSDLSNLPEGFDLQDFKNLPGDIDLTNIPDGFNLEDFTNLPFGANISDLPEGFTPDLINNLPDGFTLEDIKNIPAGLSPEDLVNLPSGFDPSNIPSGITDIDPGNIPGGITDIDPNTADSSVVCDENGNIKPGFEPFLPAGFICPPAS